MVGQPVPGRIPAARRWGRKRNPGWPEVLRLRAEIARIRSLLEEERSLRLMNDLHRRLDLVEQQERDAYDRYID